MLNVLMVSQELCIFNKPPELHPQEPPPRLRLVTLLALFSSK